MADSKKDSVEKTLRIIKEERVVFRRFKDEVRKFRILIPYVSDRSGILERKINHLMDHREKEEETLKVIHEKIKKTTKRLLVIDRKETALEVRKGELTERYKLMLAGDFSGEEEPQAGDASVEDLKKGKEKFLSSLSSKFEMIEAEIESLGRDRMVLMDKRVKYKARKIKLEARQERIKEKVALYRYDIQKNIMELNSHLGNEREIKKQYAGIINSMKNSPKLSEWGNKVFREALSKNMPNKPIIELKDSLERPRTGSGIASGGTDSPSLH